MKIYKIAIVGIVFFGCSSLANKPHNYLPKEGYVPNKETAIRIAESIWKPIYGDKINDNKPFMATLKDGKIWIVEGTLKTTLGGVPYIEIQKSDCKILKVTHSK